MTQGFECSKFKKEEKILTLKESLIKSTVGEEEEIAMHAIGGEKEIHRKKRELSMEKEITEGSQLIFSVTLDFSIFAIREPKHKDLLDFCKS